MNTAQLTYSFDAIPEEVFIELPGSKSISNRALIISHLSAYQPNLSNVSTADDTRLLASLLEKIREQKPGTSTSHAPCLIDAANAGTAFRFLTALLSVTEGYWMLSGSERMQERPIAPLVDALVAIGADISYCGQAGFPPLLIKGRKLEAGYIGIDGQLSSQFASALLMIAGGTGICSRIVLKGKPVSLPYIDMTIAVMRDLGMEVSRTGDTIILGSEQKVISDYAIEADWSSAAFFYELCALIPHSSFRLKGLKPDSIQGDKRLIELFRPLGVESKVMNDCLLIINRRIFRAERMQASLEATPDLLPALLCTCAGLGIDATFTAIGHLRLKESDRLASLANELSRLGIQVDTGVDWIRTRGRAKPTAAVLHTYSDHRLAMAFAPLSAVLGTINIEEPAVVSKSFPGFWDQMSRLNGMGIQWL